jgi:hypothetical protein
MKSTGARWGAHRTLGATRRWTTTGYATAQWKARSARRCPPPPGRPSRTETSSHFAGPNPCPLDQSDQAKHHHFDPRKQTPDGRHQIGIPAGFKSESVAGFLLECVAGFVGIRTYCMGGARIRLPAASTGLTFELVIASLNRGLGAKTRSRTSPACARLRAALLVSGSIDEMIRIVGDSVTDPTHQANSPKFPDRRRRPAGRK